MCEVAISYGYLKHMLLIFYTKYIDPLALVFNPMIRENRQLVTNEPVKFEK